MSSAKPAAKAPIAVRPSAPGRPPQAAPQIAWNDPSQHVPLAILGGLLLLLVLAYADMLVITSRVWKSSGLYSHGWVIPLCAIGLLWLRWEPLGAASMKERWIGLGLLLLGLCARLAAAEYGMHPLDRLSFLPSIFGVFIMVGGLNVVRWAGPGLGFLIFMFPLPTKLENLVLLRLQTLAAMSSTFFLQTLGLPAFRDGRVINISGMPLAVADSCSGLRMLTIFVALAVGMVFLIERPWWDKFIILLSSVPIALICNIIRITLTGLAYYWTGGKSELVDKFAHDGAGWLMMPMALGLLWLELQILERLTIPLAMGQFRPVGQARVGAAPVR